MHKKTAEKMGVDLRFQAAKTPTEAKKILWGVKRGQKPLKG